MGLRGLKRKGVEYYKKMYSREGKCFTYTKDVLNQLKKERQEIITSEKLIRVVKEYLYALYPKIQKLKAVSQHILEADKIITELHSKDYGKEKDLSLAQKAIIRQQRIAKIVNLKKRVRHEEYRCTQLAQQLSRAFPKLYQYLDQLENIKGVGQQVAKSIREELKTFKKNIQEII